MSSKRQMAEEFAKYHGVSVEPWMLWSGWDKWIGCCNCEEMEKDSECWGIASCHGYFNGCGCKRCAELESEHARNINTRL